MWYNNKVDFERGQENGQVQEAIIKHVDIDYRYVCLEAIGLFFDASLYGDIIKRAVRYG